VRRFNDSVLNEHIESVMFCKLSNEIEGKVTSMDKTRWSDLCFLFIDSVKY